VDRLVSFGAGLEDEIMSVLYCCLIGVTAVLFVRAMMSFGRTIKSWKIICDRYAGESMGDLFKSSGKRVTANTDDADVITFAKAINRAPLDVIVFTCAAVAVVLLSDFNPIPPLPLAEWLGLE
jgi:uncharacterized membrane protein